jgi:uncharacterized DUF497 family protein
VSPEFDPAKNSANLAKHGVSLADAEGVNAMGRLLVVVWAERTDDVRLISARCATARERRDYEKRV